MPKVGRSCCCCCGLRSFHVSLRRGRRSLIWWIWHDVHAPHPRFGAARYLANLVLSYVAFFCRQVRIHSRLIDAGWPSLRERVWRRKIGMYYLPLPVPVPAVLLILAASDRPDRLRVTPSWAEPSPRRLVSVTPTTLPKPILGRAQ